MLERATPYLFFLLASALFIFTGSALQVKLPMQPALIVAELFCLLGFSLYMRRQWRGEVKWPSWRLADSLSQRTLWLIPLTLLCGAIFGLFANILGGLVILLVPGMDAIAAAQQELMKTMLYPESAWLRVAAIVSVTVFAPLCEEALFRGMLLPMQREHEPVAMAVAMNGFLFALLHMNPLSMLPLWLLGSALASLTLRSKTLWAAILCHAGMNICNGVVVPWVAQRAGVELGAQTPELWSLLLGALLFGTLSAGAMRLLWLAYTPQAP